MSRNRGTNPQESDKDVLTTVTHVLAGFIDNVLYEMPNVSIVKDELLSYDTAVKKWVRDNPDSDKQNLLPLFAFNRTVINYGDKGLQRRAANQCGVLKTDSGSTTYSLAQGEFTINFMYITQSVEQQERFEVVYYSEDGISACKKITVDIPRLGKFDYFLTFNELDDLVINVEGSHYKALIGTIQVRGMYFTFRGKSGLIEEINSRIIAITGERENNITEVLSTCLLD